MVSKVFQADVDAILAARRDNGGDYWATADNRLGVGTPFSTLEALLMLHELGVGRRHASVKGALQLVLDARRDDGRIRLAPGGAIYPCHTANAARVLCRFGLAKDRRLRPTFDELLANRFDDGGWRCDKFSFGRGPETEFSNPGVTLFALDALRFDAAQAAGSTLDRAVETLLDHWTVRQPTGPCRFGIGTLFMQVEFPFLRYNLFYYVYVLSFYARARGDRRFLEALGALEAKLDARGRVVVERPHRKLADFAFCRRGQPSAIATRRYKEILKNLAR